jgi:hypothetical protein
VAENEFGGALYRSRGAMLHAIAYEWIIDGKITAATHKILAEETDAHLAAECIRNWELNQPKAGWPGEDPKPSHMEEQDYSEDDLRAAFASLRKQIADGEIE